MSSRLRLHLATLAAILGGTLGCSPTTAGHSTSGSAGSSSGTNGSNASNGSGSSGHSSGTGSSGASGSNASNGSSGALVTSLAFTPATATVVVTGTGAQTAHYVLKAMLANGSTSEVVAQSIEFDRPDLATATNGNPVVLTAPSALGLYGGQGTLHAIYNGLEATATLLVEVQVAEYGTGITSTTPGVTALNGANLPTDPATGISPLLYPYDGTVWPLGLTSPPVMWNAPNAPDAGDLYRIRVSENFYSVDEYTSLTSTPASFRLLQDDWDRLTASNGAATGIDPMTFQLFRYDAASGRAYASASETWTIAPSSLRGSIYYWTTSSGGALSQIPPGAGATPTALAGPGGNNCMGCHAVSADGSTLVAGVRGESCTDNSDNRAWTSFDLPTGAVRQVSTLFSGNLAINPDGKYVVSGDEILKLSDSTTGQEIPDSGLAEVTLDTNMTGLAVPAFSPDGTRLVAVEQGGDDWQYWSYSITPDSELVLLDFNEATTTFSTTPVEIANASQFPAGQQTISYPSFSPDSKWVAMQVADHNSGCWGTTSGQCDTTTTEQGAIYLQSTTPGTPAIRLTNLSDPPNASEANLSLEPTFNPATRGGYFWVVFTSERSWGNDADVQGTANNNKKRLWVSAIDSTVTASQTTDPSHPAFFLEGQDTTTQNMRGFWTISACIASVTPGNELMTGITDAGAACVNGFDCCSGFCSAGQCIGVSQVACAGVGGTCSTSADCCNNGSVGCTNGVCALLLR